MTDINVNKLSEALNTKADIDLNNTGVFSTVGGGGVNLVYSTSTDASGKEVTSADFILQRGGSSRNIGDIFYTTRTDSELSGAFECNGAQYNIADFSQGNQSVLSLLTTNKLPYISIANFEAAIAAYGSCRCFGWDGADASMFRVPSLTDVYLEAGIAETPSEFITESLPNITGKLTNNCGQSSVGTGALDATDVAYNAWWQGATSVDRSNSILFDASKSSDIYQNDAKVHPDSVRYRAMIQLLNKAADNALGTVTSVISDISSIKQSKANTDASNFTSSAKSLIASWGIPDYNAETVLTATPLSTSPFTAPSNGVFTILGWLGNTVAYAVINSKTINSIGIEGSSANQSPTSLYILLHQGDILYFTTALTVFRGASFFPFTLRE